MSHWSELALTMNWIYHAATILDNEKKLPVLFIQQHFGAWMVFMSNHKTELCCLADSINNLLKITRSYWSGLFHCYRVEQLPKINKDLEQVFGSLNHYQRFPTGYKKAPTSL